MRRRHFLRRLAEGGAVLGAMPRMLRGYRREPRHWTWVHGGANRSPDEWRRRFDRLAQAGIRGVLVGGGDAATLSPAARSAGLEFHRWFWTLNRSGDDWVKTNHPEWFTVSRKGDSSLEKPPYVGYYQWLCPSRPEVRQYLGGLVGDVARDPLSDGVHLDYVRHCDVILPRALWAKYGLVQDHEMAEFDFCYCEVCRAQFRSQAGRDPLDLADPSADLEWRRFRWDSVTGLVRELARSVHAQGKPITAAVFPTPTIARALVRQAWDQWPLDAVFPMTYHSFYEKQVEWIGEATREGVAALPADRPVYSGLYLPDLTPAALGTAVTAALGGGARGVSLFEMNGLTDEHLEQLRRAGS